MSAAGLQPSWGFRGGQFVTVQPSLASGEISHLKVPKEVAVAEPRKDPSPTQTTDSALGRGWEHFTLDLCCIDLVLFFSTAH